jgi:hypothetical protein
MSSLSHTALPATSSVEALQQQLQTLRLEREQLRVTSEGGRGSLEQNRQAIIHTQRQLAHALIARFARL